MAASAEKADLLVSALLHLLPGRGPEPLKAALPLWLSLKHLEILQIFNTNYRGPL